MRKITAYMGLFRGDGAEPPREAGYERVCLGEVEILDIPALPVREQIVFSDVTAPGWGLVSGFWVFDRAEGGGPLYIWDLPEPVNVHEGTIPVIYQGRLLLGIDVSANIILESANTAETIT